MTILLKFDRGDVIKSQSVAFIRSMLETPAVGNETRTLTIQAESLEEEFEILKRLVTMDAAGENDSDGQ
jgi:hypothetical protein